MSWINLLSPSQLFSSSKSIFNQFNAIAANVISTRLASKKAGGSSKNKKGKPRPKHRRIRYQDGRYVQKGTMLVTQNTLRFHPGLNVGIGKNLTLFAMEAGKVLVTCEKTNLDVEHSVVKRMYDGRTLENLYKKHFHVIPAEQHFRFKRIG
ncbi:uncharacterized protein LOC106665638 [Cimex lectularius]|uniref:Large ribosomal subunit protein bL27m n=1 Tax=Cimex lectularius TaxID=79782 RepID=A0A8I6RMH0_CIMLE|nr:uncharacterized protein LOC106665638 [Cimex lectularius]XP_014247694.1 uncharacterized protein LOC106665638 [Cimex lectularius]